MRRFADRGRVGTPHESRRPKTAQDRLTLAPTGAQLARVFRRKEQDQLRRDLQATCRSRRRTLVLEQAGQKKSSAGSSANLGELDLAIANLPALASRDAFASQDIPGPVAKHSSAQALLRDSRYNAV